MNKLVLIMLLIIILFPTYVLAADEEDEVPWQLWAAKMLIDATNGSYAVYHGNFIKEINSVFEFVKENLADIGRVLVGFVTVVSILSKVDRFENFTFITIAPAFVFFGVGLIVIQNIDVIFLAFRTLVNSLSGGIGIKDGGFISYDVILDSFNNTMPSEGSRWVQYIVGVIIGVVYTLFALVGVFAFIVSLSVTLVIEIKIGLFKFIAPIMLSGFGSPLTSRVSFGFIQGILKAHLELFYIQAVIAIFTALVSNPVNAFVMSLIGLIGVIIAVLGGGKMVFGFLAGRA